jgi:predicted MFS family arabinose efflux permease
MAGHLLGFGWVSSPQPVPRGVPRYHITSTRELSGLGLNATSNQIGYGPGAAAGGAALAVQGYAAVGIFAGLSGLAACVVYGSLWRTARV